MAANRSKAAADRRGAPSEAAEELGDIRKKLDEIRNTLRGLGAPESPSVNPARGAQSPGPAEPAHVHDEPELGGEVARLVEQIRQRNEQMSPAAPAASQAAQPAPSTVWETGGLAAAIKEIEARRAALDAERPRAPKPAPRQAARAGQDNPWPVLQRMEGRLEELGSMMERTVAPSGENDAFKMLAEHTARIEAILGDNPKTPQLRTLQTQIRALGNRLDEVANATPSAAAFATLESSVVEIGALLADGFPAGGLKGLTSQLSQFDERVKSLEQRPEEPEGFAHLEQQIAGINDILRNDDRSERLSQMERGFEGLDIRLTGLAETAAERTAVEQLAGRLEQVSVKVEQRSLQPLEEALAGLTRSTSADRATVQQLAQRIEEVSDRLEQRSLQPVEEAIEALQGRLDGLASLFESSALGSGDRENIRQIEGRMGLFETRLDRFESLVPSAGALDALEAKLEDISRAIAERPHAAEDPAIGRLEKQLAELASRVDAVNGGTASRPLEELEAQIARLGGQIEANETRFGNLGALDGTVEGLMAVVDRSREEAASMAREAANEAVKAALAQRDDNPQTDQAIEALRESLQELHRTTQGSETRRLDALGGLQDSLSMIVDRLGALEMELGGGRAPSASARVEKAEPRRPQGGDRDRSIEAGHGRADGFMLQAAMMAPRPEAADDAGSTRADFIAAARRAARHAVEPSAEAATRSREAGDDDGEPEGAHRAGRLKSLLQQKRRSIALATAAILLVIGTLQLQGLLGDRVGAPAVAKLDGTVVAAPAPAAQGPSAALASASADVRRSGSLTPDMTFSGPSATLARFETQAPAEARSVAVEAPNASVGSELLRNAAASGDARAQYEIGVRYTDGKVVARDLTEAARWYEHAAGQGLAPAQYRLGNLLEKGMGRPKDLAAARGWYEKAAKAGNRMAMHNLGVLSAEGSAAKPDYTAAIGWFREAAEHGVRDSQFNLGVIYARGLGTAQDLVESYKWFAVLSTSGDPEATRKRDEVASRLSAEDREKARATADAFRTRTVLAEANEVSAPEGGWDVEAAKPAIVSSLSPETMGGAPGGVKTERLLTQQVQALLVERGFDPGPSDGVPGRKTRDAIRAFERTTGMPETGQVTPDIFYKLASS